jgi:Protein of unknown function (DUF3667)
MSENKEISHTNCLSCGEQLRGHYCHHCGEKVIDPKHDYSIWHFIEHTVDDFTHFDLKIVNSFKNLFFKPGLLTKNYVEGRRVKFMRPVQIFIICSLLFFFFMPKSGSFYAYYTDLRDGYKAPGFSSDNPTKYNVNAKLRSLAIAKAGENAPDSTLVKVATDIYWNKVFDKSAVMSKTYLFLVLPFWGLFIYALFYRQNSYFVPHLIFAVHAFSFFLLLDMLFLIFFVDILDMHIVENHTHLLPFFILTGVYIISAVRRVYNVSMGTAIWKGLLVYLALLFLIVLYRPFVTIWALNAV